MSVINAYMQKQFHEPLVIDLSPRSLSRGLGGRVAKVRRSVNGLLSMLLNLREVKSLYLGLSGELGQIFEIPFILSARLARKRIFLHHHSYAYLHRPTILMRLICAAGGKACHIVACEKMAYDLRRLYRVANVRVVSGVAVVDAPRTPPRKPSGLNVIGFLSNVTEAKGIYEVIAIAEALASYGVKVKVAGPIENESIRTAVENSEVEYVGPVYGAAKLEFLDSIDAFLFPTKYINESEGLVIHEAMSRGVPVIANDRGCIGSILTDSGGNAVVSAYVTTAGSLLLQWRSAPNTFAAASVRAGARFAELHAEATREMRALVGAIDA